MEADGLRPPSCLPPFPVAGTDEEPIRPRLEPFRVAKLREPLPDGQQGLLRGVLGQVGVAQDPVRDRQERGRHGGGQAGERLPVSTLSATHELDVHAFLSCGTEPPPVPTEFEPGRGRDFQSSPWRGEGGDHTARGSSRDPADLAVGAGDDLARQDRRASLACPQLESVRQGIDAGGPSGPPAVSVRNRESVRGTRRWPTRRGSASPRGAQ